MLLTAFTFSACSQLPLASGAPNQVLLNEPVDISEDFRNFSNTCFLADSLTAFNTAHNALSSAKPEIHLIKNYL